MMKAKKATFVYPAKIQSIVSCGPKGTLVIQKTIRRSKRIRLVNLASRKSSIDVYIRPLSSHSSVNSSSPSSTDMSSLTQESTRYKKYGVSFDDFIEDNKDWRSFGSITYEGMKENGYADILLKKISFIIAQKLMKQSTKQ